SAAGRSRGLLFGFGIERREVGVQRLDVAVVSRLQHLCRLALALGQGQVVPALPHLPLGSLKGCHDNLITCHQRAFWCKAASKRTFVLILSGPGFRFPLWRRPWVPPHICERGREAACDCGP